MHWKDLITLSIYTFLHHLLMKGVASQSRIQESKKYTAGHKKGNATLDLQEAKRRESKKESLFKNQAISPYNQPTTCSLLGPSTPSSQSCCSCLSPLHTPSTSTHDTRAGGGSVHGYERVLVGVGAGLLGACR
jgi:hypothetical protein